MMKKREFSEQCQCMRYQIYRKPMLGYCLVISKSTMTSDYHGSVSIFQKANGRDWIMPAIWNPWILLSKRLNNLSQTWALRANYRSKPVSRLCCQLQAQYSLVAYNGLHEWLESVTWQDEAIMRQTFLRGIKISQFAVSWSAFEIENAFSKNIRNVCGIMPDFCSCILYIIIILLLPTCTANNLQTHSGLIFFAVRSDPY